MATEQDTIDRRGNAILNALPRVDRDRVLAKVTPTVLKTRDVLFEPGKVIRHVHFPLSGVISLVTPLEDGNIVEVATIGNEGLVGVPLQRHGSLAVRAISQVAGQTLQMDASAFLDEVGRPGPFRRVVENYTMALFGQISQAAACNRLHSSEERLSRWLLMSRDRVGSNDFAITHEFLGQMLGARRATVTLSAGVLQAAGLIRYHRGRITISDAHGLEEVACECYGVIRALFAPSAPTESSDSTGTSRAPA